MDLSEYTESIWSQAWDVLHSLAREVPCWQCVVDSHYEDFDRLLATIIMYYIYISIYPEGSAPAACAAGLFSIYNGYFC